MVSPRTQWNKLPPHHNMGPTQPPLDLSLPFCFLASFPPTSASLFSFLPTYVQSFFASFPLYFSCFASFLPRLPFSSPLFSDFRFNFPVAASYLSPLSPFPPFCNMLSSSFASCLSFFLILCYSFLIYLTVTHK
jgi:hypothetical protein